MSRTPRPDAYSAIQTQIGRRVRQVREFGGDSKAQAARTFGIDPSTFAKIEDEPRPASSSLLKWRTATASQPTICFADCRLRRLILRWLTKSKMREGDSIGTGVPAESARTRARARTNLATNPCRPRHWLP